MKCRVDDFYNPTTIYENVVEININRTDVILTLDNQKYVHIDLTTAKFSIIIN